jgi:hypothetical protein
LFGFLEEDYVLIEIKCPSPYNNHFIKPASDPQHFLKEKTLHSSSCSSAFNEAITIKAPDFYRSREFILFHSLC